MTNPAQRLTPIPESPQPPILPDRGTWDHGVPITAEPAIEPEVDWPDEADSPHVKTEPPEPDIPPVAVTIVGDKAHQRRDWRGGNYTITPTGDAIRLVGENSRRTRILVRNLSDTDTVFLLRRQTDGVVSAFPLDSNSDIEIFCEAEVCAKHSNPAGANALLGVIEEFRINL